MPGCTDSLARKDRSKLAALLSEVGVTKDGSCPLQNGDVASNYLALGACCAVLQYASAAQGFEPPPRSVLVEHVSWTDFMPMDTGASAVPPTCSFPFQAAWHELRFSCLFPSHPLSSQPPGTDSNVPLVHSHVPM